jgi:beta-phosphoglucomutase-like phosphatase (HAD superfamily)
MGTMIFDLNGTLVDSEHAHWVAYRDILSKHDLDLTFEEFAEDWIRHGHNLAYTIEKHGRQDLLPSVQSLKKQKDKVFRATIAERVTLMPGVTQTIAMLSEELVLVVDSSSKNSSA